MLCAEWRRRCGWRALLVFGFMAGIGLGALEHHDIERARIILGLYVVLSAIGTAAAVYYLWGKK
jgi:hypothetical protein